MPSLSRSDDLPVHRIRPDEERIVPEADGYGLGGEPCGPDTSGALAKRTRGESGVVRYWLKRCMAGHDSGRLYNPQSPLFDPASVNRFFAELGRGKYEFREVPHEAFEHYLRFLRKGNPLDLRHAERAI